MPETAQEALARDIILAAEHQEAVRKVFRRERDRLAAKPDADPVREAEWAAAIAALWVVAAEQVYPSTVTDINPGVTPGPAPDFGGFIQNAVEGIVKTTRRRIEALRLTKPLNLSRQLRKLYQVEFIQKRAPRIALDQALRQTASFEDAAAKKVEEATGVPLEKVWHNQGDSRVRSSHLSVAAVLLDQPFLVGGTELRYPRDPAGAGRETFGCRCWAEHREATEETLTPAKEPAAKPAPVKPSQDEIAASQAQKWEDQVQQFEPDFEQGQGAFHSDIPQQPWAEMETWHSSSMREMLGHDDLSGLDGFIESWTVDATPESKRLASLLAKGNADDVLTQAAKMIDDLPQGHSSTRWLPKNLDDADAFVESWQANQKLAAEVSKIRHPDGLTLYRGINTEGSKLLDDFAAAMKTGDLDDASLTSNFVDSWSLDPSVAVDFASSGTGQGLVLKTTIQPDDVITAFYEHPSFNMFNQSEVLWANTDQAFVPKVVNEIPGRFSRSRPLLEVTV